MADAQKYPLAGQQYGSVASSEAATTTSAGVDTLISPTSVRAPHSLLLFALCTYLPSPRQIVCTVDLVPICFVSSAIQSVDVLLGLQEQYEKNMGGMIGSLFDPHEEEDIPLLYFKSFGSLFKWLCSWMIPGLGMFSEAYFIFSIGNIKPILTDERPNCFSKYKVSLLQIHYCSLLMCSPPTYVWGGTQSA